MMATYDSISRGFFSKSLNRYKHFNDNVADGLSILSFKTTNVDPSSELSAMGSYLNVTNESSIPILYKQIRAATQKDPLLKQVYGYEIFGWSAYLTDDDRDLSLFFEAEIADEQGDIPFSQSIRCCVNCVFQATMALVM